MKKVLLAIAMLMVFEASDPEPAKCAVCAWSLGCYDSSVCGQGCRCLKRGMDLEGFCYSVE